jgi:Holliday junction resolvase RusA-like endonuclease
MRRWAFEVPIPPRPKERPRFANGKVHTPRRTKADEDTVALYAALAMAGVKIAGPVELRIKAVMTGRPRIEVEIVELEGEAWHTSVPDVDNVAKLVMDGLKSCWRDDSQIARLVAEKVKE